MAVLTPWFEATGDDVHKKLYAYLKALEQRQSYRDRDSVRNLGLYEDREVVGLAPGMYHRPGSSLSSKMSLPITGALVDTAQNMIAQTQPLAMALTEGGDWLQQQHAKDLNHFIEGQYYGLRVFDTMQDSAGDMGWNGTGVIYVDREEDKPIVEKVFPNQMLLDDALCEFSEPFEQTRRWYLPRDKVKRLFPGKKSDIDRIRPMEFASVRGSPHAADLVAIYTTWRLRDGKKMGRKVTLCESCVLQDKPYKKDYFPFVYMRWRKMRVGFWGRGIPSIVDRLQTEINKTVRTYSKSVALCAIPRLLLPSGAGIDTDHLNNDPSSGIWYSGQQGPSWLGGQVIPPEMMQYLQFLVQQIYQDVGISEMAAGMKKPAGLNSGEAQRVYADKQADRFALPSQAYENASVEIAKRLIGVARDIAEEYGDYAVSHQTTKGFRRIKWSEIDLGEDEYTLKLWPVNYLSKSPADMIDQVNDLIKMGLLSGKQAKRLIPFPDLEGVMNQENAAPSTLLPFSQ